MNLLKYLLLLTVLICAFPLGYLLAKSTKEELKQGRKAFIAIIIISPIIAAMSIFLPLSQEDRLLMITSMLFIAIFSVISLKKRQKKKPEKNMGRK